jgi:hypothetical protein
MCEVAGHAAGMGYGEAPQHDQTTGWKLCSDVPSRAVRILPGQAALRTRPDKAGQAASASPPRINVGQRPGRRRPPAVDARLPRLSKVSSLPASSIRWVPFREKTSPSKKFHSGCGEATRIGKPKRRRRTDAVRQHRYLPWKPTEVPGRKGKTVVRLLLVRCPAVVQDRACPGELRTRSGLSPPPRPR